LSLILFFLSIFFDSHLFVIQNLLTVTLFVLVIIQIYGYISHFCTLFRHICEPGEFVPVPFSEVI